MCTASWIRTDGGYDLFFNRDESRLRSRARPPDVWEVAGTSFLAPRDADGGGTWIAVNADGVSLCLLNRYQDVFEPDGKPVSRGLLVAELAVAAGLGEVLERLESKDLRRFRPFTLLVLGPAAKDERWPRPSARSVRWNGVRLAEPVEDPARPLTSSGADPSGVAEARRELWLEMVGDGDPESAVPAGRGERESRIAAGEAAMAFHRSHRPARGALSPCMHRLVASTVSFTHVRVTPEAVSMAYADGPPCAADLSPPLTLLRHEPAVC